MYEQMAVLVLSYFQLTLTTRPQPNTIDISSSKGDSNYVTTKAKYSIYIEKQNYNSQEQTVNHILFANKNTKDGCDDITEIISALWKTSIH